MDEGWIFSIFMDLLTSGFRLAFFKPQSSLFSLIFLFKTFSDFFFAVRKLYTHTTQHSRHCGVFGFSFFFFGTSMVHFFLRSQ